MIAIAIVITWGITRGIARGNNDKKYLRITTFKP
jgi:hypothetical protein